MNKIQSSDRRFLQRATRAFGLPSHTISWSDSKARHPDCWIQGTNITVTDEWARQNSDEKKSRLTHELLHSLGEQHGRKGNLVYSTFPEKDSYSKAIYRKMFKNPVSKSQLQQGMKVELEHRDITGGDPVLTRKIVDAHLRENKRYYTKLKKAGLNPWFWQEHMTKQDRKDRYNLLKELGASTEQARGWRDVQPYKFRGKMDYLRKRKREGKLAWGTNPEGSSLLPLLLVAGVIGIAFWISRRRQA